MTPHNNQRLAVALFSSILLVTCRQSAPDPVAAPAHSSVDAPIVSFKIQVPEAVLRDLKQRLAHPRFTNEIEGAGWEGGPNVAYMKEIVAYWRDTFDWRKQEQYLNRFDHFKTTIDGLNIHFLHQRSKHPNARPLILLHGWGGPTFYELIKIIDPLTDPVKYGGKPEDAFHVVVPDAPGYGFSDHPRERGWGYDRMSRAMMTLMARLGYMRYAVHGGDIGGTIGRRMAIHDAAHVFGLHMNSCGGGRFPIVNDRLGRVSDHLVFIEDKQAQISTLDARFEGVPPDDVERTKARESAYAEDLTHAQANFTKAQTIGYGLNDSPVGLLGWYMEKMQRYCDCDGHPETKFTKDELITWAMMYWLPQAGASSGRSYRERDPAMPGVDVPTAVACFPKDVVYAPRKYQEQSYNLQRWTLMPRGGHYPALEQPELLVADIRDFFRDLK